MSKIDRNTIVPIPENAYISKTTGKVFYNHAPVYHEDKQYYTYSKRVIGHAVDDGHMYPNTYYMLTNPSIYNDCSPDVPANTRQHLSFGLYAAVLGVATEIGLYPVMVDCFGPEKANAILDFAMYSMLTQSSVAKDFQVTMQSQMLFSERSRNENWYSKLFEAGITDEKADEFKRAWARKCSESGDNDYWIACDGSNDMCGSESNILAEDGHPKPGNTGDLVSFMTAINTNSGKPISYHVYRGGRIDSKEISHQVDFLTSMDVRCKGLLIDRGFACSPSLNVVAKAGYDYLVMLTSNCKAYQKMHATYGKLIRNNVHYALDKEGVYGTTSENPMQLFDYNKKLNAYVHIFYDDKNGSNSRSRLVWQIKDTVREANKKAEAEREKKTDDKKNPSDTQQTGSTNMTEAEPAEDTSSSIQVSSPYIITVTENGQLMFVLDEEKLQETVDAKGISVMASSIAMTANDADRLYQLRQYPEKEYTYLKTQLGYDVLRVQTIEGWLGKFCVGFISSIVRWGLEQKALELKMDVNHMIREMCLLEMSLDPSGNYVIHHSESKRQVRYLKAVGVSTEMYEGFASDMNNRMTNPIVSPIRKLPEVAKKRGPGRPAGSKNKKTLEREASEKRKKSKSQKTNELM